jgi:hypothetical protein
MSTTHQQLIKLFDAMNEPAQLWLLAKAALLAEHFAMDAASSARTSVH